MHKMLRNRGRLDFLRQASRYLGWWRRSVSDLLFPRKCAGCLDAWMPAGQGLWCEACLDGLPWIESPLCPCCGRPFPKSAFTLDHLCGECLVKRPAFDWVRSAVQHTGVVRERVNQFKFGAKLYWGPPLTDLLVEAMRREGPGSVDYVVAVPLHTRRLRQRGFNQAALLARFLSRRLDLPVRFDLLVRSQWTHPQTRLSREERLHNVKGAFTAARPQEVKGRRILLLDDVFTTGTTVSECSKTLKKAGAVKVYALTVTRALPEARGDWETS